MVRWMLVLNYSTSEEYLRQAARRHHAERVAITPCILRGDQPLLAGKAHEQRATLAQERLRKALVVLAFTQIAPQAQLVVEVVRVSRRAAQLRLDVFDRACVEQVAELLLPEQLA